MEEKKSFLKRKKNFFDSQKRSCMKNEDDKIKRAITKDDGKSRTRMMRYHPCLNIYSSSGRKSWMKISLCTVIKIFTDFAVKCESSGDHDGRVPFSFRFESQGK